MDHHKNPAVLFACLLFCLFLLSCNNDVEQPGAKKIVSNPGKMDKEASESIRQALEFVLQHDRKMDDTTRLQLAAIVNDFYDKTGYNSIWSHKEKWEPLTDSLYRFIQNAALYGLFANDYHFRELSTLKTSLDRDSVKRMDATLWTRADLLFTDAFMLLMKDLKKGRLYTDSNLLGKASLPADNYFEKSLQQLLEKKQFANLVTSMEPKHKGYQELKYSIGHFIDSMDSKPYTYLTYPYKVNDEKDSIAFIKNLQKRLSESNCISLTSKLPDSGELKIAIKKYQHLKKIKEDSVVSVALVKAMNNTDVEKFKRIAITLDRYKLMEDTMPVRYIWVNLPGYYLQVWDTDTLTLESRIICGKPITRTPVLTSVITDMVTYPTWTVPTSIIAKSYLPKLKNNPNYLSRIGLRLINNKGEKIDPSTINWGKYSKGIPFKIMQGSGDNNALGVLKFNFDNPYGVYLHDTNERYLFKNASRAFSHGCVRVQEWEKLAFYIARNDSVNVKPGDTLRYNTDSISNWLAKKQRKRIDVKNGIPLFIRYFSCEGKEGRIKFYDDIYGEDKVMREKYFADK